MTSLIHTLRTASRAPTRRLLLQTTPPSLTTLRPYTMIRKYEDDGIIPPAESLQVPKHFDDSPPSSTPHPGACPENPVTSAHCIDLPTATLSTLDSATITPDGDVRHGRYGVLPPALTRHVPLEYLALLHPAAEAAAALRALGTGERGTLLVYGAGQAAGLAALQMATARGLSVVGVVGGEHSGNDAFLDTLKCLTREPGFAVAEEVAIVKKGFADLVEECVGGESGAVYDVEAGLEEFKTNVRDYVEMFPKSIPGAASRDMLVFRGKDRDRKYFKENMEVYLEQFGEGAAPISDAELAKFTPEQYDMYKLKNLMNNADLITNDFATPLNPSDTVKEMCAVPEPVEELNVPESEVIPYRFTGKAPESYNVTKGGPIAGAVIAVTPYLKSACEAINKATSLRDKAETLQFLTQAERNAFAGARSVVQLAQKSGVEVVVVGGELSGFTSVQVADGDVDVALKAMDVREGEESSDLNYFIQVYKAQDFPFYADYAVHRALEPLAGPRQFVVTK